MSSVKKYKNAGWKGFIRAGWEDIFSDLDKIAVSGEQVLVKLNREVRRIETDKGVVFYKKVVYSKKTFPANLISFLSYFLRRPRSLSVWKVSEQLLQADLGCAIPIMATYSYKFSNLRCEDIFVATEITFPLISILLKEAASEELRKEILNKAGLGIRELHDKGFIHGDCIPGNICMDEKGKLYFIDNDRTVKYTGMRPAYEKRRNLIQFASRALTLINDDEEINSFLMGYYINDKRQEKIISNEQNNFREKLKKRVGELENELGEKLLARNLRMK